jgi:hypothetical protein
MKKRTSLDVGCNSRKDTIVSTRLRNARSCSRCNFVVFDCAFLLTSKPVLASANGRVDKTITRSCKQEDKGMINLNRKRFHDEVGGGLIFYSDLLLFELNSALGMPFGLAG